MSMKIYVGTSGWMYHWNKGGTFDWYVKNSGLNCVELNASYYRFPFKNQVLGWARKSPESFRWAVKVNRFVTHVFKMSNRAFETWVKFRNLFEPLDPKVDFYLFQLPPFIKPSETYVARIERFVSRAELGDRFALEWRHVEWFSERWEKWAEDLGITLVSVDAPDLPRRIFAINGTIYLRMHGRTAWYSHVYSEEELREVAEQMLSKNPRRIYVFFNNDTGMLVNGRQMMNILREMTS
ncbi:MAG: DUF72 domain-containing protein [Candidatus Baldrarchaeia archaeon]